MDGRDDEELPDVGSDLDDDDRSIEKAGSAQQSGARRRPPTSCRRNRPGVDDIGPRIFEIPHVSSRQDSAARAGYGGNLAVGLADRPTYATSAGRYLRIGSGGGAVEWQNPLAKAKGRAMMSSSMARRLPVGMIATP